MSIFFFEGSDAANLALRKSKIKSDTLKLCLWKMVFS